MTNPLPDNWIDLYLDHELSPTEQALAEQILANDPQSPERLDEAHHLHQQLKTLLPRPQLDQEAFLRSIAVYDSNDPGRPGNSRGESDVHWPSPTRGSASRGVLMFFASVLSLLLMVYLFRGEPETQHVVATLVRSTGTVEVLEPHQAQWTAVEAGHDLDIRSGTRLRTPRDSLCEVSTQSRGVVRVNQNSEICFQHPNEVELKSGQLWCKASPRDSLLVSVPVQNEQMTSGSGQGQLSNGPVSIFTCPQGSETVWQVDNSSARCTSVDDHPTQLRGSGNQEWIIDPGAVIACEPGRPPEMTHPRDRLQTVSWQLPLLNLRTPRDPELQDMLHGLLAAVGQSKMGGLYDDQIRDLGPAGTIPLIAFVQSPRSRTDVAIRRQAMRIISDLAPPSLRSEIEGLMQDSDDIVARLARKTIQRLGQAPE